MRVSGAASRAPVAAGEAARDGAARVLCERARALARRPAPPEEGGSLEAVEFRLAGERYAVEAAWVREVYPLCELCPVPCTPAFVMGIINLRGEVVSVIDLGRFFELPARGLGELSRVIVLRSDSMELGVLADDVVGVRRLPLRDVQPPLPTHTGVRADYLRGVTGDGLVVLDGGKLLSDRRLVVNEEV